MSMNSTERRAHVPSRCVWSSVLWGWKDRWGYSVVVQPQYFITDSIEPGLDKLFQIIIMWLCLDQQPSGWYHTRRTIMSSILTFHSALWFLCCPQNIFPFIALPQKDIRRVRNASIPTGLLSLLHLALWNVLRANQWQPPSNLASLSYCPPCYEECPNPYKYTEMRL